MKVSQGDEEELCIVQGGMTDWLIGWGFKFCSALWGLYQDLGASFSGMLHSTRNECSTVDAHSCSWPRWYHLNTSSVHVAITWPVARRKPFKCFKFTFHDYSQCENKYRHNLHRLTQEKPPLLPPLLLPLQPLLPPLPALHYGPYHRICPIYKLLARLYLTANLRAIPSIFGPIGSVGVFSPVENLYNLKLPSPSICTHWYFATKPHIPITYKETLEVSWRQRSTGDTDHIHVKLPQLELGQ